LSVFGTLGTAAVIERLKAVSTVLVLNVYLQDAAINCSIELAIE